MNNTPPLLVQETLKRVLRIARFDGMSVLGVAGLFALLAAGAGDYEGAVIGVLVAGAGAIELHGTALLQHRDPTGMEWLVRSQLVLLAVLLAYCGWQLTHVDLEPLRTAFRSTLRMPLMQEMWATNQELGITEDMFLKQIHTMTYVSVAAATVIYQGAMARYYARRRDAVTQALAEE